MVVPPMGKQVGQKDGLPPAPPVNDAPPVEIPVEDEVLVRGGGIRGPKRLGKEPRKAFDLSSPQRQEYAIAHYTWSLATRGEGDMAKSLAWGTSMKTAVEDTPEMGVLLSEYDFETALVAIEVDKILRRLPWIDVDVIDKVMDLSGQQLEAVRKRLQTDVDVIAQSKAHANMAEALTTNPELKGLLTRPPGPVAQIEGLPGNLDLGTVPLEDRTRMMVALGDDLDALREGGDPAAVGFLHNARGGELAWVSPEGRLVAEITDSDGVAHLFDIRLDGEIGDTALDALGAITEALWGQKHEVLNASELPGDRTLLGSMFTFVGDLTDPVFRLKDKIDGPLNWALDGGNPEGRQWRSSDAIVADRLQSASQAQLAAADPNDVVLAGISMMGARDGNYLQVTNEMTAWWDEMSPEQREDLEAQLTVEARAGIEDSLANLKDDRHSAKRALDDVALATMDVFSTWERFVQGNFVSVVDFLKDFGESLESVGIGDTFGELDTTGEGMRERFVSAFEWEAGSAAYRGEITAADYFGVSDEYRGLVNFAASLVGDPLTWTAASGVARGLEMKRLLTTGEAGINELLRKPHMQPWLAQIFDYSGGSNNAALYALVETTGISDAGLQALIRGDEVMGVLRREMVQGDMIPTLTGGLKFRNSAQWVARMSNVGDNKFGNFLRHMLGQYPSDSAISLSAAGFRPEFGQALLARSTIGRWLSAPDDFSRWLNEMLTMTQDGGAQRVVAVRAEVNRAARRNQAAVSREQGYGRMLNDERTARVASDRVTRLETELAAIRNNTLDPDGVAAEVIRTQDEWVAAQTPATRQAFDDAVAVEKGLLDLPKREAAIERQLHLMRNADAELGAAHMELIRAKKANDGPRILAAAHTYRTLQNETVRLGIRFPRGLIPGTVEYEAAMDAAREWGRKWSVLKQQRDDLYNLKRRIDLGGPQVAMDDLVNRFVADWGAEVFDLPPGTPVADMPWDRIVGTKEASMVPQDLGAALAQRVPGATDDLLSVLGRAFGPSVRGSTVMPASPMKMVAYQARKSDGWWAKTFIPNPARQGRWSQFLDFTRKAFAFNLLINPYTWIRSNLDEPLRDLLENGVRGWESETMGHMPGAGARGANRLRASFGGPAGMDDISNSFARVASKPYAESGSTVPWIARTTAHAKAYGDDAVAASRGEFLASGQNLFNGVLPNQPLYQAYGRARHFDDLEEFYTYWDEGGGAVRAGTSLTELGAVRLDATTTLRGLDNVVDFFAGQIDNPEIAGVFRRQFYRALATGKPIDAAILSRLKLIPAQTMKGLRNPFHPDASFHWLYGRPSEVHRGQVARNYYAQAKDILTTRHGENVLTARRLADMVEDLPEELAAAKLHGSSDMTNNIVREHGLATDKTIHVAAARQARVHADHMAYAMGASTLGGLRLGQSFPFLKAQLDFLGYYYQQLTNGTALSPKLSSVLQKIGIGSGGLAQIPGLPLNLRLASRIADFGGSLSTIDPESEGDYFQNIVDDYTFLPSAFDDRLFLQIAPGMGPLPSWLLHGIPIDDDGDTFGVPNEWLTPIRRFIDNYPAFAYDDRVLDFQGDPWGSLFQFGDFLLPNTKTSIRRVGQTIAQAALSPLNQNYSSIVQTPPGFQSETRTMLAAALLENPYVDLASAAYREDAEERIGTAWGNAARGAALKTLENVLPFAGGLFVDPDDAQWLEAYRGFKTARLDWLYGLNHLGDAQYDRINELWAKMDDHSLSRREGIELADALSGVLFGLPDSLLNYVIVLHPDVAVNLITQWEVDQEKVPDDVPFRGDRLVSPPGQPGRDLREEGERMGWLRRRSPEAFDADGFIRVASAARGVRNEAWQILTGLNAWQKTPGSPNILLNLEHPLVDTAAMLLDALGVQLEGLQTRGELAAAINAEIGSSSENRTLLPSRVSLPMKLEAQVREQLRQAELAGFDPEDPETWPAAAVASIRELFQPYVRSGIVDEVDYNRDYAPYYGNIDLEPLIPPDLDDVPIGETADTFRFSVPADLVGVVDGDTVELPFTTIDPPRWMGEGDGIEGQRIRLIGINAAEVNESERLRAEEETLRTGQLVLPEYMVQTEKLQDMIAEASIVDFVVFEPDRFATLDEVPGGDVRWLMVMYLDGVPVWDDRVFSVRNPSGAGSGGEGVPD